MFTGIIEQTGTILSLSHGSGTRRIAIRAPGIASRLHMGDSCAVSGVCLTALDIDADAEIFHADLAEETVARTSLSTLAPGSLVNLELPTAAGSPLGGHVVQGHVDGTGRLLSLDAVDPLADPALTDWWLRVETPANVNRFMIEKGSIAIEGISLTIASVADEVHGRIVSIAILPHTYWRTNLHSLRPGQPVNIEADVLLKFAEEQQRERHQGQFELTEAYLVANGY
jgi:riboflavin synthase